MLDRLKTFFWGTENPTPVEPPAPSMSDDAMMLIKFSHKIEVLANNSDFPKRAIEALESLYQTIKQVDLKSLDIREQFNIKKMLETDIPQMLEIYCSLPKAYAVSYILENGKTSKDTLIEQICVFNKKISNMNDDILTSRANQLLKQQKTIDISHKKEKDFFDL